MTAPDDVLLAPAVVRRVEHRARRRGAVVGVLAVAAVVTAAVLDGPSGLLLGQGLGLGLLVTGVVTGLTTLRTAVAANRRAAAATGHRKETRRRWSRALAENRVDELDAEEAARVVEWAEAALVSVRLWSLGWGLGAIGLIATNATTLVVTGVPMLGGGLGAQVVATGVLVATFVVPVAVVRREHTRLLTFLGALDP